MELKNEALFITLLLTVGLTLLVVMLMTFIYERSLKYSRHRLEHPEDWLFHNFHEKIYGMFYGDLDGYEAAIKLGVKIEDYHKNCILAGIKPEPKRVIIDNILSLVLLSLTMIFTIIFHPLFLPIGAIGTLYLMKRRTKKAQRKAETMREQVSAELPMFLRLLATELEIGLEIDTAITILSSKSDTLIAKEFLNSLNDVKLGGISWQVALEKVAEKYELDTLSNFVQDITVAYSKGVSVAYSVGEKAKDIKHRHYLEVKEKAAKTENTILIPIAMLQLMPVIMFTILPTFGQLQNL